MSRLGGVQGAFEDMPMENQPYSPTARNALARALRPGFVGLKLEDYLDVTDEHLDLATPEALKSSLIGVEPHSSEAVAYWNPEAESWTYIAVTPTEFGLLSGSIKHLGERAVAGSQKKRQRPNVRSSVDNAAAVRAGLHAVTNRATATQLYLDNDLRKQNHLIKKFQEAARYPGLARFGSEGTMREQLAYLRTYVFGGMITTIGNQRDWNSTQQIRAQKAINARLFLDRSNNRHIENFKGMLDLAAEWNSYKQAIIATRQWQVQKYIKQHEPNAEPSN